MAASVSTTFATRPFARLAESDADAFAIQKIAGYSDIRIISRYVHPTPEHIQKAFTRLQEYNARQKKKISA